MRRLFIAIVAIVLLFPSGGRAVQQSVVLQARGDLNLPPYEFLDASGQPSGFNVDLLRAVASATGLEVEIELGIWDRVRDDVENGRIDIVTGMIASAEREGRVDFSSPILTISYAGFIREDSTLKSVEELHGKQIIVQRNDIMHDYAQAHLPTAKIIPVDTQIDALRLLASGKYDVALTSRLQGLYLIHKFKLGNVHIGEMNFPPQDICFAVTEDNDTLQAKLNEGLRILKTSGEYEQIYRHWFGSFDRRSFAEELLTYALWVLGPLLLMLLAAGGWSWTLKRQVRRRTQELQRELEERQRVESELESERHFRSFVAAAPVPMAVIDRQQRVLYLNDKFSELFGYAYEDIPDVEAWLNQAYPEIARRRAVRDEFRRRVLPRALRGEESILMEGEISCKDGSLRYVRGLVSSVGGWVLIVFSDITDLKGTELALSQSEARLKGIFHNLAAGIEVLDSDGALIEVNDRLAEMLGYQPRELLGKSPLDFTHPDDLETSREFLQMALQGRVDTYRREKRYVRKDGSFFWGDLSFTQVVDRSGEVIADIGIIFDISARKMIEQQLRAVNRELEAFVYSVSHDLRTPLTPIIGYAEHLIDSYQDALDEQALDCLREIGKGGERMLRLIEDLLTLAKVGHLERPEDPVDVDALVDEVLSEFRARLEETGARVERRPLPPARVPHTLLHQLFDNLIGNALRYGSIKGEAIELGGEKHEGRLIYYVRDHGPGIPADERDQIFQLFYRGSTSGGVRGTGIGLAIVQKITHLYGGMALAEETPGGGTTILVEFDDGEAFEGEPAR